MKKVIYFLNTKKITFIVTFFGIILGILIGFGVLYLIINIT